MIYCYVPYLLRLDAPLLIPRLDGDPNSALAMQFLPGSTLRGFVAGRLGDPGTDPAALARFRALVLGGAVRYLNAYAAEGGYRSLPAPRSLRLFKGESWPRGAPARLVDLGCYDGSPDSDHDVEESWPERSLGDAPAGFLTLTAPTVARVEAEVSSRMHQQRDREVGRAWKKRLPGTYGSSAEEERRGAIYAYESLDAGQDFRGLLQVRAGSRQEVDGIAREVCELLGGQLVLGRSRRAGYGGSAVLTWGAPVQREVSGEGVLDGDLAPGTQFRVLLTSSYIGRDRTTGQNDPAFLSNEVVAALGGRAVVERVRWSFAPVGGYNRKWGLPLPQALAAEGGSLLVLRSEAEIPEADLRRIEDEGLGERRAEGFGRLVFLTLPRIPELLADWPIRKSSFVSPPESLPAPAVLEAERRIVAERLTEAIAAVAAQTVRKTEHPPSNSLLGRLRLPLRGDPERALATLQTWLGDSPHGLRRPARLALSRCRVCLRDELLPLQVWLLRITVSEDPGRLLGYDGLVQQAHIVSEQSARASLLREGAATRVRLIDSVLALLQRRNKLAAGDSHE